MIALTRVLRSIQNFSNCEKNEKTKKKIFSLNFMLELCNIGLVRYNMHLIITQTIIDFFHSTQKELKFHFDGNILIIK